MTEPTVAVEVARALRDFAVSKGVDKKALDIGLGGSPVDLEATGGRVPLRQYLSLIDSARELSGEPALALEFGERVSLDQFSLVGSLSGASRTVAESLEQLNRYSRLLVDDHGRGPHDRLATRQDRDGLWVGFLVFRSTDFPAAIGLLLMAGGVAYLVPIITVFLAPRLVSWNLPILSISGIAELAFAICLIMKGRASRRP